MRVNVARPGRSPGDRACVLSDANRDGAPIFACSTHGRSRSGRRGQRANLRVLSAHERGDGTQAAAHPPTRACSASANTTRRDRSVQRTAPRDASGREFTACCRRRVGRAAASETARPARAKDRSGEREHTSGTRAVWVSVQCVRPRALDARRPAVESGCYDRASRARASAWASVQGETAPSAFARSTFGGRGASRVR